jgi:hypothetical protein
VGDEKTNPDSTKNKIFGRTGRFVFSFANRAAANHSRVFTHIAGRKVDRQKKWRENAHSLHSATTTTTGRPDDRRRDANRAESRDERVGESGFETVGAAKRVEQGAERGRRGERATRVELLDLPVDFFVVDRGGSGT